MVECDLPKVEIAGSSPVSRSMVTKGMFWKRFYFVFILLSCNCFLLCSNRFCEVVKKIFGCGQSETTNDSDNGPVGNQNDNNFGEYNNKSNNNSVNVGENGYEDNNNSSNEEENNNSNNNLVGETLAYDVQKDKNEIDLNGFDTSKIISPFKCVFFSDTTRVGKSSIITYLKEGEFVEGYVGTIGLYLFQVEYEVKNTDMKEKIQLYDTSGAKERREINYLYIKDANAIVFVYDITNVDSFSNLEEYIKQVNKKAPSGCWFFLLGNKFDLIEQNQDPKPRKVTIDHAKKFAADNDLIFLGECSAKENTYMPGSDEVLYCKGKGLIKVDAKCTEGLHGMLKDIIYKYYISLHD